MHQSDILMGSCACLETLLKQTAGISSKWFVRTQQDLVEDLASHPWLARRHTLFSPFFHSMRNLTKPDKLEETCSQLSGVETQPCHAVICRECLQPRVIHFVVKLVVISCTGYRFTPVGVIPPGAYVTLLIDKLSTPFKKKT